MRMSDEDFDAVIDTNLAGTFRCVRRASTGMIKARGGRIILISSVVGPLRRTGPGQLRRQQGRARRPGALGDPRARRPRHHRQRRGTRLHRDRHDRSAARRRPQKAYKAGIPAGRFAQPERGRRRRALPRRRTTRATSRARSSPSTAASAWATDPPTSRTHTPTTHQQENDTDAARGQEAAHHGSPHGLLDRLPRRQAGAGAGRRGRAHVVRPDDEDHPDHRQAAADDAAGGRARRHRRRAPRHPGRAARRARRPPRRRAALDRLRAAGRVQLPRGDLRGRLDRDARLGLLAQVPRRRGPAAHVGRARRSSD